VRLGPITHGSERRRDLLGNTDGRGARAEEGLVDAAPKKKKKKKKKMSFLSF
jgi:hypothetical protein